LLSNQEKEKIYRVIHNGFKWGTFQKTIGINQNQKYRDKIMNCKFCKNDTDTITHLLLECQPIQNIWSVLEKFLIENDLIKETLNRDMILYNYFENRQKTNIAIILGITAGKIEIIKRKELLDIKNEYNWDNVKFQEKVLWIIKTKNKNECSQ